jgi:hypothetical protein
MKEQDELEPTRTILCSSAMYLAKDAGLNDKVKFYAEKIIEFNIHTEYVENAKEEISQL